MSQVFTDILTTTTMGTFPGLLNANMDAIRSQWSGTSAPGNPVIGQPFYNTTNDAITVWDGTSWNDIASTSPSLLALTAEIVAARGSAATLNARLSVALNDDGTLKGDAPVGDWWMTEADAVSFVDAASFTVEGDKTAIYLADRAVWLDQTTNAYGYVVSSSYNAGSDLTTVVVSDVTVDSGLTAVEYGQPPLSAPNRLKEEDIGVTVQPYGADTVVAPGGVLPTLDGSQLTGLDADATVYDNTTSGLIATDVQAAIDEVAGGSGSNVVQQKFIVDNTKASTSSDAYVSTGVTFSLDNDLSNAANKVRIRVFAHGGGDSVNIRQEVSIYDGSAYLHGVETCLASAFIGGSSSTGAQRGLFTATMVAEDIPGTVTPKTYDIHHKSPVSGTVTFGRNHNNDATAPTVIIIEEIAV